MMQQKEQTVGDALMSGDLDIDEFIAKHRKPTTGEFIQGVGATFGNAVVQGVTTGNAGLLQLEAKALGLAGMDKAARYVRKLADAVETIDDKAKLPVPSQMANTGLAGTLTQETAQALGSVGSAILVPGIGKLGAASRVATQGAVLGFGQGFYEAKGSGASEEDQWLAGLGNAGVGALEGFGGAERTLASLFARADKGSGGALKAALVQALKTGASEASMESLQQLGSNIVAQHTFDEDRAALEGVLKSGRAGGLAGLFIGALVGGQRPLGAQGELQGPMGELEAQTGGEGAPPAAPGEAQATAPRPEMALPVPIEDVPDDVPVQVADPAIESASPADSDSRTPEYTDSTAAGDSPVNRGESVAESAPLRVEEEPAPVEAPPPPSEAEVQTAYGISNAAMEEDMARIGQPYPTKGETITWESENEKASAAFAKDAETGTKLVDELVKKPRALTTSEGFVLSQEAVRRNLEFERASDALAAAADAGQDTTAFKARVDAASDRIAALAKVADTSGTLQAQAFGARAAMLREDFSLAGLERMARNAQDGKQLDDGLRARLRAAAKNVAALQKRYDDYLGVTNKAEYGSAAAAVTDTIAENAAKAKKAGKLLEYIDAQADAAMKRIRARGMRANSGVDPTILADWAIVGMRKLAHGIVDLKAWTDSMLADFGDDIRPHLSVVRAQSEEMHANSPKTQARLKGYKTRTRNATQKLRQQIAERNFIKQERAPLPLDDEAIALKAALEKEKIEARRVIREIEDANRTATSKAVEAGKELLNLPRAIMSSFDFSAVFRQGGFFTLGHPVRSAKHVVDMLKAAKSEDYALRTDVRIKSRPGYEFGQASGLQLTDLNDGLGPREEAIRSRLSDRIPGVRMSNRAYITMLNLQRAAAFDAMVQGLPSGRPTIEEGRAIANFVNVASGRGSIRGLESSIQGLGLFLWAPRLYLSRLQLLTGQPAYGGTMSTRAAISKEYARWLVGLSAVYSMARLAGGELEEDPRSSDFGKIQLGNTRIDPLSGLAQFSTLGGRLATGEMVTLAGQEREAAASELIGRFLRTKLTPILGLAIDVAEGENLVGEKMTVGETVKRAVVPLSFQDIKEAIEERGVAEGAALSLLAILGMSVQTYGSK